MAALVQQSPQEATLEHEVRALDLPKGVKLKSVVFDVDFCNDPATYVTFSIARQFGLGSDSIKRLNALRQKVFSVTDRIASDRLTYVRFMDAK